MQEAKLVLMLIGKDYHLIQTEKEWQLGWQLITKICFLWVEQANKFSKPAMQCKIVKQIK